MTLSIFLCAIAVWAVLRHQQRRHGAELAAECRRRGLLMPDPSPAVPALESVLTVVVGVALVAPSATVLAGAFAHGASYQWKPVLWISTVGLASGAALLVLGFRSLLRLRKSLTQTASETQPPS